MIGDRAAARRRLDEARALIRRGRHARAIWLLRDAIGALRRRGEALAVVEGLSLLGRLWLRRGRPGDAGVAFAEARDAASSKGLASLARTLEGWRALALIENGEVASAEKACGTVTGTPRDGADTPLAWCVLVRCRLAREQHGELLAPPLERLGSWRADDDLELETRVREAAVRAWLAAGRIFEAGRCARAMLERNRGRDDRHAAAIAAGAHAAVLAHCGDGVLLRDALREAVQRAGQARAPLVGVEARLACCAALECAGLHGEAARQRRCLARLRAVVPATLRDRIDRALGRAPRRHPHVAGAACRSGAAGGEPGVPGLVVASAALTQVARWVARAARVPFPVLITGESGVGKELVARGVHALGPRRARAFCAVNCGALPEELLDAELFGHARGAFTGALTDRAGLLEAADGGTLFLDEVSDLAPRAQARLLRVLQEREFRRLGESRSRRVDVRVVAAANRDMQQEARAGRFREDLLYRLDVVRIVVPPLRERPEDVPALVRHFWRQACETAGSRAHLSAPVLDALARYPWPGNVRELQNVLAVLAVAAPRSGPVTVTALPARFRAEARAARLADARAQFERRFIQQAIAREDGSRTRAAAALGLSRQGLRKKMARLGLEPPTIEVCGDG